MENKINIKSDEITEILGTPPRWIVRWGITVLFLVVAILFVGSMFFRYPDLVVAPVVITAENPPSTVVARATGKPAALFVSEGAWVKKADTLGVIENPANFNHVFKLAKLVKEFNPDSLNDLERVNAASSLAWQLGDLQPHFNSFSRACSDLAMFKKQNYHEQKLRALENEYKHYLNYYDRLWSQRSLTVKDLELTRTQFLRDSILFACKVIAATEFEKSQASLIAKKQQFEASRISLSNAAITIERLKQSIADTQIEFESQQRKLADELVNAHALLVSMLASWEKNFLLIAPTEGRLSFMAVWSNVQEVKAGEPLFAIVPNSIGNIQARLVVPFEGSGKVRVGQKVNIKLNGFSFLEYGLVEATIHSMSGGYTEQGYPAVAHLPNGAITTYGFELPMERELMGIAEIVTDDLTVLERLMAPIRHLYKSKVERDSPKK